MDSNEESKRPQPTEPDRTLLGSCKYSSTYNSLPRSPWSFALTLGGFGEVRAFFCKPKFAAGAAFIPQGFTPVNVLMFSIVLHFGDHL